MLGGTEPGSAGYGLYAGKGWSPCARASVDPARGTLRIPSTVAKAAFTSVHVSRRIGCSSLEACVGNVLLFRGYTLPLAGRVKILLKFDSNARHIRITKKPVKCLIGKFLC